MSLYFLPPGREIGRIYQFIQYFILHVGGIILFKLLFLIRCSNTIPFESEQKGNERRKPSFSQREAVISPQGSHETSELADFSQDTLSPSPHHRNISLLLKGKVVQSHEGVGANVKSIFNNFHGIYVPVSTNFPALLSCLSYLSLSYRINTRLYSHTIFPSLPQQRLCDLCASSWQTTCTHVFISHVQPSKSNSGESRQY